MTKLNDYRHPADDTAKSRQEDVVEEISDVLSEGGLSPWTESCLEIFAEQIVEADDGLSGDDPRYRDDE